MDIQEMIIIHCVSNGEETRGWVHTHGMAEHGCPELEIRGVPLFLMDAAGALLNDIAEYMIESAQAGKPVQLGHVLSNTEGRAALSLVKLPPIANNENHYEVERWTLSDEPMRNLCCECGGPEGECGTGEPEASDGDKSRLH